MNDERTSVRRLFKYLIPVIVFSVLFNIPKFLEAELIYDGNGSGFPELGVTSLRLHKDYVIYYNHLARLLILGVIPFILLVFFNTKIYKDVMVSFLKINKYKNFF